MFLSVVIFPHWACFKKANSRWKIDESWLWANAKARANSFTGKPILAPGGFDQVAKEALKRLNVDFQISEAEQAYQTNGSTKIPANTRVKISKRFNRTIKTDKFAIEVVAS